MAGLKPLPSPISPSHPQLFLAQPGGSPSHHRSLQMMNSNAPLARSMQPRTGHRAKNRKSEGHSDLQSGDLPDGHDLMAVRSGHPGHGHPRQIPRPSSMNSFDRPRSPPGSKNTSHVPCKFFRQGACQAGKACPFSHSVDPASSQAPCKYFAKGNCKFGAKCALAHILPDGRRVNRPNSSSAGGNMGLNGRMVPEPYQNPPSALASSILHAHAIPTPLGHQYSLPPQDDFLPLATLPMSNFEAAPVIETGFVSSHPGSNYGSPRDDIRFPLSPIIQGLSALDAPLPASFDSNGISWIARNGPVASSVPSKFGLESPPHSFKEAPPSEALRTLHDSAFGNGDRSRLNHLASSPPPSTEESPGHRIMHSQRYTKPKMMSSSLPRAGATDDWDSTFAFEEDFIPNSLHELLTPQEKMRRSSRSGGEDDGLNTRLSLSGFGTPGESSSKVGSPTASSPSRFGPLFSRQKKEEDHSSLGTGFGHVGSPLRNSLLNPSSSPGLRPINRPASGDISPHFASPPRQSSMSMISQQLQRTRLSKADSLSSEAGLHLTSAKQSTNPAGKTDRAVSSSSIGNGRTVSSIDEEPGEVFSMEEEEDTKRYGDGWNYPVGGRSPGLGPIGGRVPTIAEAEQKESKEFLNSLFAGR